MFEKTRFKLTAWYLLIIMLVSASFSIAVYKVLTGELDRVERMQRQRQERLLPEFRQRFPRVLDPELVEETKNRLKTILFLVNLGILGASSLAGYFLAGRTLKPIKEMIDEQNRFITDASHELRTPLTSLKSEIEVNLRDKNLKSKDARRLLESNLEEVNNLQYLSDRLITLTQSQNYHDRDSFEKVSLVEVLNEAQKKMANLAKQKNIAIKNNIKDFIIEADKQGLIEVFVIILDNAIKYSAKGKTVILTSQKTDGSIVVNVGDQGMGIAGEDLPHVFNRFYRADKSRAKKEVSGYGLGLSIAKQIVDKHHGSIKVLSQINKGTTFSLLLPIDH